MPTLVVSDWLPNGSRQLARAAQQAGWNVLCLEGKELPAARQVGDAVYYGGTDVAQQVAKRLDLALLEPLFDWLAKLPRKVTLREVRYATVADARQLIGPAFVKPADALNKCFDCGVYPGGWAIPERRGFSDCTPVILSEPVTWTVEYRCFVLEGKIMTYAPYVREGRWIRSGDHKWSIPEAEAHQVTRFCQTLVGDKNVQLPPALTLDVGVVEGKGWAVVEANPVWCSGLYGCDPAGVLPVLRRACVRQQVLTDEDRQWVIGRR